MAKECVDQQWTTRQLGYRIRRRVAEIKYPQGEPAPEGEGEGEGAAPGREPDPAADAVNAFIADLDQLIRQAAALNPESLEPHMNNFSLETRGSLEYRVMALSDSLEATRMMCQKRPVYGIFRFQDNLTFGMISGMTALNGCKIHPK